MSGVQANLLLAGVQNASPWLSTDELQAPAKLAMAQQRNALLNRMDEQTLASQNMEMIARASAYLETLPDTAARQAAYPGIVSQLQQSGFAKNAPSVYPGDERISQLARMGTPSKELLANAATARAKQMLAPDGTTPAATAPASDAAAPDYSVPRGIRNNNPLNLSFANQPGATLESHPDPRFARFATPEDGVAAAVNQLKLYQSRGNNTLRGMISTWAPPSENDTEAYIRHVAQVTGLNPDAPVNLNDPAVASKLVQAMARHETGRPLDAAIADRGVPRAPSRGVAARTGGVDVAGPGAPTKAAPAVVEPETGLPVVVSPGAAPAAPAQPTAPLPQAEAVATAARTGQPVPILNGNGLVAHPDGNVGPPRQAQVAATTPAQQQTPAQSQTQAPAQPELPPLPPLQTPPRLEANGYSTAQNRQLRAAQLDPKVSTEEYQRMLAQFGTQNQSATDKALEHNLSIQRELRQRIQDQEQRTQRQQDYKLRLEAADRAVEESQRQREAHQRAMETQGVPTGYRRNPQTGQDEPDPGYKGALKEGFQWDPNNPGKQIFVEGGPADPAVIAKQDAARRTGGRVMGETERSKLIEQAGLVDSTGRLSSTFKPEFGGFFSGTYGDFRNWVASQTPGESPRADWWREYQRTNVLGQRHAIIGATMTPSEKAEYEKADINPGMSPETILQNLAVQQRIVETARNRRVAALAAEGYNKEAIAAASGIDPDEVTAPTSKQQAGQPLNVRPGGNRPPLSSFQR